MTQPTYLSRSEASDFLKSHGFPCAKGQLQKLACRGGGPRYRQFGNRTLYTPEDLLAWANKKLSPPRSNTSEAVEGGAQ